MSPSGCGLASELMPCSTEAPQPMQNTQAAVVRSGEGSEQSIGSGMELATKAALQQNRSTEAVRTD